MDDAFKIFVDQLRDGQEQEIDEKLSPLFMDVQEKDLSFPTDIHLNGKAYTANQDLILDWNIKTEALISCSICNESVSVPLQIEHFYHAEPLDDIKSGVFNFKDLLRETILLEVPAFVECHQGRCPHRKEYSKYLKEPKADELEGDINRPFANLDWE